MSYSSVSSRNLGFIGIVCGFLSEAAAALPLAGSEVIWLSVEHSLLFHVAAALLGGAGAASLIAPRGFRQWAGPALLFSSLALVLPVAGLFAVMVLTLLLLSHQAQVTPGRMELVEIPSRRESSPESASVHTAGPLPMPLVSLLPGIEATALQSVVLGLQTMPPALTRPILHRLQKHSDVRVQLYANGLLNDQLDHIERRLAVLKQRVAERPGDEDSLTAIVETYRYLFDNHLIASDEVMQMAGQALKEAETVLELNPCNPVVLQACVEFHLLRGEFREAAIGIEQLRPLAGQQNEAAALSARFHFEQAAAQDVPHSPAPAPPAGQQSRPNFG